MSATKPMDLKTGKRNCHLILFPACAFQLVDMPDNTNADFFFDLKK